MRHQWLNIQELTTMRGRPVYTSDGEKLGEFEEIYRDAVTGELEWIRVKSLTLDGILSVKHFLVPLAGAEFQDGENPAIRVPYSKEQVQDAPDVEGDWMAEIDGRRLYNYYGLYYGLQVSERRSETQLPEGGGTQEPHQHPVTPQGDVTISRHEEELQVGKREVEYGRIRLRKWVETEPVSEEVTLRRQTAFVKRQPVNRPASGTAIGEEEVEMPLHREEPVVSKETMEREQIILHMEEETHQETVHDEVRREHVEVEDDSENIEEHRHR